MFGINVAWDLIEVATGQWDLPRQVPRHEAVVLVFMDSLVFAIVAGVVGTFAWWLWDKWRKMRAHP